MQPGTIVLLNGTPRSGKSSIAAAMQESLEGIWVNLGVDHSMAATPQHLQPGIGLRPGGERPDLEPTVLLLYQALYASIAAYSRMGVHVVADVGHHDCYSKPLGILPRCARILDGLPAMLVGVRCPIGEIMRRRADTWGKSYLDDGSIPPPILRWQEQVHIPGIYDLQVDTSLLSPSECAGAIGERIARGGPYPSLAKLAEM